jgi:GNAT superfamily N-acetyltransferase
MEIHPSARKHGVADADIEHAIEQVMTLNYQDDRRLLYLGPSRSGAILEVVKVIGLELVIHANAATPKHERLLSGCRAWR